MKLHLPIGPEHAPERGLFNDYERKRFVMLTALLVMVIGMFVWGYLKSGPLVATVEDEREEDERPEVQLVLPEVDREGLNRAARDATAEERVILETPALEQALATARRIGPDHFEPMGGRRLTPEVAAELVADPSAHRGDLLRAYGTIEAIDAFDAGGEATAHYRGRMRLEGGGAVWFAALMLPDDWGEVGQFVRLDGLFVELYRGQGKGGAWIDAPLIAGKRLVRAYPELGPLPELEPMVFAGVEDDSLQGISPQLFEPFWQLLAHARDLPPDAIDWEAAPLLDAATLQEVYRNGDAARAQPFRIPPCQVIAVWHEAQPENPARIGRLVKGWASNGDWVRGEAKLIQFVAPLDTTELRRRDWFTGTGFFLKNQAYEADKIPVAIAPYFVLHSLEPYVQPEAPSLAPLFAAIGIGMLALFVLIFVALMRDRRKAQQLQEELRRRRRARRAAQPQQS